MLPSKSATPTATLYVFPLTATPEQVIVQTTIPAPSELYPSPDGTLIAAEYTVQVNSQLSNYTIQLYTLSGQELGVPYTSNSIDGRGSWLSDSSGLVLTPASGLGGSMLIMDRQGHARPLGLAMRGPELSPDGRWIGGTAFDSNNTVIGAEIVPRSGGPARMLASGGVFTGWQNGRAVYTTGGSGTRELYALDPSGGAPLLIAQYPPDNPCFGGPPYQNIRGDGSSPDGLVPYRGAASGVGYGHTLDMPVAHTACRFLLAPLSAAIGTLRGVRRRRAAAVPTPRSARLWGACCNR